MNVDMFPGEELLIAAEKGDPEALAQLDSSGFLLKPDENAENFVERIRAMHSRFLDFLGKTSGGKPFEIYRNIFIS